VTSSQSIFQMIGIRISIDCADSELRSLVEQNWSHLATPSSVGEYDLKYTIGRSDSPPGIAIVRDGQSPLISEDSCQFLYDLEHDITLELQRRRSELFFLHAGAVEIAGQACLLVAESGQGKSTIVWSLLHHGFGYLSDELAPLDVSSMCVYAYPHALCLKSQPPASFPLPRETIRTSCTMHVPTELMPRVTHRKTCPVGAMFFVTKDRHPMQPSLRTTTAGEASARLYSNALNQLAHPNAGLDSAVLIAESIPGYVLETADLDAACNLIRSTLVATDASFS